MNDDLQSRLAAADPLADPHSTIMPAPSRLDATKERIASGDTSIAGRTFRRFGRPAAVGLVGALLIAGASVGAGILGTFQAAGDGVAGQELITKGSGCAANAVVTVTLDGQRVGSATADPDGLFIVTSQIPVGTSLGRHELRSICGDNSGQQVVQTTAINVVTAPASLPPKAFLEGYAVAGVLSAKGSGCAANAPISMTLDGQQVGRTTADGDGFFGVESRLPAGTSLGQHQLQSTCVDGAGRPVVQTATITVVESEPSLPPKTLP